MRFRVASIAVGAAVLVGGMAAATAVSRSSAPEPSPVVTTPIGADESLTEWAVVGTSDAGRVLVIGSLPRIDACHSRRAELVAVDDRVVRVRNVYVQIYDDPGGQGCGVLDVDVGMPLSFLRLREPLRGRRVEGPGKRSLPRAFGQTWDRPPREQTGLPVRDAITNLKVFGYRRSDIRVRGPRSGYVTRITPRLPTTGFVRRSRPIVVHSRALHR